MRQRISYRETDDSSMNAQTKLMAAGAAASLSLSDVDYHDADSLTKDGKTEEEQPKRNFFGYIMYCVALSCGALSVGAIVLETSTIVYVGGGFGILGSLVALFQQNILNKSETFRQVHNKLRKEVNKLQEQNNILSTDINNLENKMIQLEGCEDGLERICSQQNVATTTLVKSVKENQVILDEMEGLVKKQLMGQIISTIITLDRNNNFIIDDHELNECLLRIKAFDAVTSVNETGLRNMLRGQSLDYVIDKARNFVNDPTKGSSLIVVDPKKLQPSSVNTIPYNSP